MKKAIWIDITNVPHVNFLYPIIEYYRDTYNFIYSIRDFAETKRLFEKRIGCEYINAGNHKGGNKIKKVCGMISRNHQLYKLLPHFDCAISVGGSANTVAKLRKKPTITFDDNDKSPNWIYAPFSDLAFWPKVIDKQTLMKQFFKDKSIYQYNGYKEDFYIADYVPDVHFKSTLPFDKYVVVRAENTQACYVGQKGTIVPELLSRLYEANINVLFLPRYESDKRFAGMYNNIFIPKDAINGMDACYFADAILTGAGTMAREAACIGVPAVSFYAGDELLTVDQSLIRENRVFHSRNVDDIMRYLQNTKRGDLDLERCRLVKNEIINRIDLFLDRI